MVLVCLNCFWCVICWYWLVVCVRLVCFVYRFFWCGFGWWSCLYRFLFMLLIEGCWYWWLKFLLCLFCVSWCLDCIVLCFLVCWVGFVWCVGFVWLCLEVGCGFLVIVYVIVLSVFEGRNWSLRYCLVWWLRVVWWEILLCCGFGWRFWRCDLLLFVCFDWYWVGCFNFLCVWRWCLCFGFDWWSWSWWCWICCWYWLIFVWWNRFGFVWLLFWCVWLWFLLGSGLVWIWCFDFYWVESWWGCVGIRILWLCLVVDRLVLFVVGGGLFSWLCCCSYVWCGWNCGWRIWRSCGFCGYVYCVVVWCIVWVLVLVLLLLIGLWCWW